MAGKGYEFEEHPADIRLRAWSKTLDEVFAEAARGMMEHLFGDAISEKIFSKSDSLQLEAQSREELLVDWLSELLYLATTRSRVYLAFEFKQLSDHFLSAELKSCEGELVDDIKGVTYHGLEIKEEGDVVFATVTFDV